MSLWRITVKALYEMGGRANTAQIADSAVEETGAVGAALWLAKRMGRVEGDGNRGGMRHTATWTLTARGTALCEGRIRAVLNDRGSGRPFVSGRSRMPRFVATWLSSLPKGIRIEQPERAA